MAVAIGCGSAKLSAISRTLGSSANRSSHRRGECARCRRSVSPHFPAAHTCRSRLPSYLRVELQNCAEIWIDEPLACNCSGDLKAVRIYTFRSNRRGAYRSKVKCPRCSQSWCYAHRNRMVNTHYERLTNHSRYTIHAWLTKQ